MSLPMEVRVVNMRPTKAAIKEATALMLARTLLQGILAAPVMEPQAVRALVKMVGMAASVRRMAEQV